MRSSPNSSGQGESPATQSVAGRSETERVKLATVALELVALGLDDLRRRVGDEPLVREHVLGPGYLLFEPCAFSVDVSVDLLPLRLHDHVEDPLLVALEWKEHAAPPEDRRRLVDPVERAGRLVVARDRPRRDDQPRLALGEVRPD